VFVRKGSNPGDTAEASSVTGVAVADLRIADAALSQAQATLRTAGNRLAPVVRTLQGIDTEVAGADPLIGKLQQAQQLLGTDFGIVGQALVEVAGHVAEITAAFTQADQQLSQAAGAAR
jgi:ABC-type transporter Mla subunit MlaD